MIINDAANAAYLFGAARRLREATGLFAYNQAHDPILSICASGQQKLGAAWDEKWNEGQTTPIEQIVATVLSLTFT